MLLPASTVATWVITYDAIHKPLALHITHHIPMKFIAHTLVNSAVALGKNNEESKTPNLAHPLQHETGKLIGWIAL